jgi:hypothetical protein
VLARIFLYLFCHDFRKINGRIKIFEKCTSAAVPHGVKSLPRLVPAAERGGRILPPSGTAAGPYRRATWRWGLFYFLAFHF